jgi:hypothetical protein
MVLPYAGDTTECKSGPQQFGKRLTKYSTNDDCTNDDYGAAPRIDEALKEIESR